METVFKLTISSVYRYVKVIKTVVEEVLKQQEVSDDQIFFLKLTVSEAVLNIIEHVYKEVSDKKIDLKIEADRDKIVFEIRDYGPDMKLDFDLKSNDGLGLNIIKSSMDDVQYKNLKDGNVLILTKKIKEENFLLDIESLDENSGLIRLGPTCFTKDVREIRKAFDYFLEEGVDEIRVDFSRVKKIDSSGIGVLVMYYKKSKKNGYKIVFTSASEEVKRVFKMMNIYAEFDMKD